MIFFHSLLFFANQHLSAKISRTKSNYARCKRPVLYLKGRLGVWQYQERDIWQRPVVCMVNRVLYVYFRPCHRKVDWTFKDRNLKNQHVVIFCLCVFFKDYDDFYLPRFALFRSLLVNFSTARAFTLNE